jgi:hypothetical protein
LATMTWNNVHTPEMRLVKGLDVRIAVEAQNAHKDRTKRAEDDRLRRAPKMLTNRLRGGDQVVGGRGGECERGFQERFASELCIGLSVLVSQLSNHGGEGAA